MQPSAGRLPAPRRFTWLRLGLFWLGGALLCAGLWALAATLPPVPGLTPDAGGTPNWFDVIVVGSYAVLAWPLLDPMASHLARRRWGAKLALAALLVTALLLGPWLLLATARPFPVRWLAALGEAAFTVRAWLAEGRPVVIAVTLGALGFGITALALSGRILWLALLGQEAVARGRSYSVRLWLVWHILTFVIGEYSLLLVRSANPPFWLDLLIFGALILLAERWLSPLAAELASRRGARLGARVLVAGMLLLALLSAFGPSEAGGLWVLRWPTSPHLDLTRPHRLTTLLATIAQLPAVPQYERLHLMALGARGGDALPILFVRMVGYALVAGLIIVTVAVILGVVRRSMSPLPLPASARGQLERARASLPRLPRASWVWPLVAVLALGLGAITALAPNLYDLRWEPQATDGLPAARRLGVTAMWFAPDGRTMLAATADGIYRSEDGYQWRESSTGLESRGVRALVEAPGGAGLLAAAENGIYRSDDGGQTWRRVDRERPDGVARAMVLGPGGRRLFAIFDDTPAEVEPLDSLTDEVYASGDGGVSWYATGAADGGRRSRFTGLLATDEALFAWSSHSASNMLRSTDDGASWQPLPTGYYPDNVIAGTIKGTLLAGGSGGWYARSPDGGDTWESKREGGGGTLRYWGVTLARDARGDQLYALVGGDGLYASGDDGVSWRLVQRGLAYLHQQYSQLPLLFGGPGDGILYAATQSGLLRSDDGGATWRNAGQGLEGKPFVRSLASGADGALMATTSDGVFRSEDGGESWRAVMRGLATDEQLLVAFDTSRGYVAVGSTGTYVLDAAGASWSRIAPGPGPPDLEAVLDRGAEGGLVAVGWATIATLDPSNTWVAGDYRYEQGSLGTTVNGRWLYLLTRFFPSVSRVDIESGSYETISEGLPSTYSVSGLASALDGSGVYSAAARQFFRFDPQSATWRPSGDPLPAPAAGALLVGLPSGTALASAHDGLYRGRTGGGAWERAAGFPGRPAHLLFARPDGVLFAAAGGVGDPGGLYRSTDDGRTWSRADQGLAEAPLRQLAVGADGAQMCALSEGAGVARSTDGGRTWHTQDALVGVGAVTDLLALPSGGFLAATSDGVMRSADCVGWEGSATGIAAPPAPVGPAAVALVARGDELFTAAGTQVYQSTDEGRSWLPLYAPLGAPIQDLAIAPGREGLYVATESGVFLLPGGSRAAQDLSPGLPDYNIKALGFAEDGISLDAQGSHGALYRRDPQSETWSVLTTDTFSPSRPIAVAGGHLSYAGGALYLDSPSLGVQRWGVSDRPPIAVTSGGDRLTFYALSGVTLLRAEAPLPLAWRSPEPVGAALAAATQASTWVRTNALPLLIGPALLALVGLLYVVVTVVPPTRTGLNATAWLLTHPRYLLAAAGYRTYRERVGESDALEQLVLLFAPTDGPFSVNAGAQTLRRHGAAADEAGLRTALLGLARRGLARPAGAEYSLVEPHLAEIHRRILAPAIVAELVERTRSEHPLFTETTRFFEAAQFEVAAVDAFGLLCTSDARLWREVQPLYARLVLERALDLTEFQALCDAAAAAYGGAVDGRIAAVVIDQAPRAADLYQIFALRAQRGLTVVPLSRSLMLQARLEGREVEVFSERVEEYAGRTDLYDVRAAVTDVLSFFGRTALLADLQRRLTTGRSALVVGVRKMGKSSLMGRLREECGWPVAYIDLQGFVSGLSYAYGEALDRWRQVIAVTHPDLALPPPLVAADPSPAGRAQVFRQSIIAVLDLLANLPDRPGLLLFLDEFDSLIAAPGYVEFAAVLRGIAEHQQLRGRFAILAAGLDPLINRADHLAGQRNPLFSFFGEIPLAPLDDEDVRTMIVAIGGQMGVSYADGTLALLAATGGGHPFLTRQLCSQTVRALEHPAIVDEARAAEAIEVYLRQPRNYLAESLWDFDAGGPPGDEAAILRALAAYQPLAEAALLPPEQEPAEQRGRQLALDRLMNQQLVRRGADGYALTIPLYRRWLRRVVLRLADEE